MNWLEKWRAMDALSDTTLHVREDTPRLHNSPVYASNRVEMGGDGMLKSLPGGGGTPEEAIESLWLAMTGIPADRYLVVAAMNSGRKHYRWNGYMWDEIPRDKED